MEQNLRESDEDYAFRIQLEETLNFSNFTADVASSSTVRDEASPSLWKDETEYRPVSYVIEDYEEETLHFSNLTVATSKDEASSFPKDENEYKQDYGFGGGNRGSSRENVDTGLEWLDSAAEVKKPCGICFDDSAADMCEGIHCSHSFCQPCMTKYIHSRLEQKRHQICCPHESCPQTLTPQECRYFLPVEIMEAWSALMAEAEIPELQKVYCPFRDCSAILVNEDVTALSAEEILNAECPSCNRMFCVRCMIPWHADLDCEEFQRLPPAERSEEDRRLFKLAEERKWQRCGKCKSLIELDYGCNHMTCRCGHEFCYECGTGWTNGGPTCDCPRTNENRLLRQT